MKSKHSEKELTNAAYSLRRYCYGVLGSALLYCISMVIAMQLDRPAHSGRTVFEKLAIETYDWLIFPTALLQSICNASTQFGIAAVIIGAGVLCGIFIAVITFLIKTTWKKSHNREVEHISDSANAV
jgi:hypothetical protein